MSDKKKRLLISLTIIAIFVGYFAFAFNTGMLFIRQPDLTLDYSSIIRDNVSPEIRVVDIAMLGAHDALSEQITPRSSVEPHMEPGLTHTLARFTPGWLSRLMQAQVSDAHGQLTRGIRYFDVRITYYNDTWYTYHTTISAPLEFYLVQFIDFLSENPGELIIFDIQHAILNRFTFDDLWEFIEDTKSNGASLFDFITYDPYNKPLGELTLGEATKHGAGVVLLAKTDTNPGDHHYEYFSSIRSNWHNQVRTGLLLEGIRNENIYLRENFSKYENMFRVNQAQLTANYGGFRNLISTVFSWSLISRNAYHNVRVLNQEDFSDWLEVMPIYMVDYADSPIGNFNVRVIEIINEYNRGLR